MTQHTLRYGLTTALRPIELPIEWNGKITVDSSGFESASLHKKTNHGLLAAQQLPTHTESLAITAGKIGTSKLTYALNGNVAQHTTIKVGAGAHVTILVSITGRGAFAGTTTLILEPGSKVQYSILQDLDAGSVALIATETELVNAELTLTQATVGSANVQLVSHATVGANATIETRQVVIANGHGQVDAHASTVHVGAHSASNMLSRGILDGSARGLFHGLIRINPESFDVDSYQKTEAILLSETAGADAIPNLEIHDHRVRCSHGASIGRLDSEKLFYLMSRGIDEQRAKRAVTEGFIVPLLPVEWVERVRAALGYAQEDELQ